MAYGSLKVDNIIFTNGGVDQTITVSGIVAATSGNLTVTGTISGDVVQGGTLVSGATVTGSAGQFTTLTGGTAGFTTITGTTVTGTTAQFTSITGGGIGATTITGTTVSGTTANFASGVFTAQISGATVTGTTANFTSGNFTNISGGTHTITSGVFASGSVTNPSISFIGDSNTGIYASAADQVSITTSGTERVRVDATGQIEAVSLGSATAPTYSFTTDPNTGIFSPGADQLAISTNGTGRLFVDASGRVGVGTSSPSEFLDIQRTNGTGNLGVRLVHIGQVEYKIGINDTDDNLYITNNNANAAIGDTTKGLTITPAGNVGINTTTPSAKLNIREDVTTATAADLLAIATASGGGFNIECSDRSAANPTWAIRTFTDEPISFKQGTAERMRLDSSGRLGLGTSSPSSSTILDVNGNARIGSAGNFDTDTRLLVASTGGNSYVQIQGADSTGVVGLKLGRNSSANSAGIDWSASTDKLTFRTGGTTAAVTIDASQRVGIGTTSPTNALQVDSDSEFNIFALQRKTTPTATFSIGIDSAQTVTNLNYQTSGLRVTRLGTEYARIDSSGRLLVGTSSSSGLIRAAFQGNIGNAAGAGVVHLQRGEAAAAITEGEILGELRGTDNADNIGAVISFTADATWGAGDYPGRLVFSTTADGASSPTERLRITNAGVLQVADAGNIAVGTTTGTKIGTATTQKLGFYNATPVVQPTAVADATDAATAISQLNALLAHMRTLGLIAT